MLNIIVHLLVKHTFFQIIIQNVEMKSKQKQSTFVLN